jgi:POT family proton-dependent oligopeptide transporter
MYTIGAGVPQETGSITLTDGTRCMNIGAQSRIVATFIEKYVGFWAAYLMSLCSITLSLVVFVFSRKGLGKPPLPIFSLNRPWLTCYMI